MKFIALNILACTLLVFSAHLLHLNAPTAFGQILLQVNENGEAWYIDPVSEDRFYLKDGSAAFELMRTFGLGITNGDLVDIPSVTGPQEVEGMTSICESNSLANRLVGRILLQVEENGEAWYVEPTTCHRVYLKDGNAAFEIMHYLGLGASNEDIESINLGETEEDANVIVDSDYSIAPGNLDGWFTTGQDASIMLSGIGFNEAGGSLLFNHPGGLATDGERLLMVDKYNNRVLIWNELPLVDNVEPDLVLGQENFDTNASGSDLTSFNWPTSIATDGTRVIVADTENDRVLVWNTFPTENKDPADFAISNNLTWPWAVWTDGNKLIATGTTGTPSIRIWNTFPTDGNEDADVVLTDEEFGTPRTIGSDGSNLVIGDHNGINNERTTFFWNTFPTTNDEEYDFYVANQEGYAGQLLWSPTVLEDGSLLGLINNYLLIWDEFPTQKTDEADLVWGGHIDAGAASGIAVTNEALYLSLHNDNKILGFYDIPDNTNDEPDFVIGAPDAETNTLETYHFISNPMPVSVGGHLFVSSDYDDTLSVWTDLPDESGAYPNVTISVESMRDNAAWGDVLVGAGRDEVYIWEPLPTEGQAPRIIQDSIGSVIFDDIRGVAVDDNYFYLSDPHMNRVYIWEGLPEKDDEPIISLETDLPFRLSSDGTYLIVTKSAGQSVEIYEISSLSNSAEPIAIIGGNHALNLPQYAIASEGSLFIADSSNNRVLAWEDIQDAISGNDADVILGQGGENETNASIGQNSLFSPTGMSFDGSYLWVGEFKFSGRILRFDALF